MKRCIDLFIAVTALFLLLPAICVVAILVRWRLGSPVLFRQLRPGRYGRPFVLLKFRTMTDARSVDMELLPDAERLTPFGLFLRRTSLDELPQLWNVMIGDMSLIGPRPLLMEYMALYSPEQARRHEVRPGITGWAQVNGRNGLSWADRFRYDVWYVDHWSFGLDIRILWLSILTVLRRNGVSEVGQATMSKFTGSESKHD